MTIFIIKLTCLLKNRNDKEKLICLIVLNMKTKKHLFHRLETGIYEKKNMIKGILKCIQIN